MSRVSDGMDRTHFTGRRLAALVGGLSLIVAACGGGADEPASPAAASAASAADENAGNLAQADSPLDIEVLNVADGSVSSLRQAVDGDRPVLVWFYAPH